MKPEAKFLNVNLKDIIKSLIVSFFMALVVGVYELIKSNGELNWMSIKTILLSAFAAALSYIGKNFLTNSNDQFLKKEQ